MWLLVKNEQVPGLYIVIWGVTPCPQKIQPVPQMKRDFNPWEGDCAAQVGRKEVDH